MAVYFEDFESIIYFTFDNLIFNELKGQYDGKIND